MKFQAKTYKRLGAMVGAIVGVFLMIIAVCAEKNMQGDCSGQLEAFTAESVKT